MERIRGVEKIVNDEQYTVIKQLLEEELKEYKWAATSSDPIADITTQIDKNTDKLKEELTPEEERSVLRQIQMLQVRHTSMKRGTYFPALRRNITAHLLAVEQYEASMEKRNFFEILHRYASRK